MKDRQSRMKSRMISDTSFDSSSGSEGPSSTSSSGSEGPSPNSSPNSSSSKIDQNYRERELLKMIKTARRPAFLYSQNPKTTFLHGSLLNVRVALSWLSTQLIKQKTVYKFYHSTRLFIKRPCSSDKLSTLLFKQTSVYNSFLSSRFFN